MNAEIDIADAAKKITLDIKLTGVSQFRFRLWLGSKIMKLAALIIGCGIEVSTE